MVSCCKQLKKGLKFIVRGHFCRAQRCGMGRVMRRPTKCFLFPTWTLFTWLPIWTLVLFDFQLFSSPFLSLFLVILSHFFSGHLQTYSVESKTKREQFFFSIVCANISYETFNGLEYLEICCKIKHTFRHFLYAQDEIMP